MEHFASIYILKKYIRQFSTQRLDIIENVVIPSSPNIPQQAKFANTLNLHATTEDKKKSH